ncbi:MAG: hypothetical protein ACRDRJ_27060 [Streptosporangiaceae bacterium]
MSATRRFSDPGTRWTVPDPRELALRIRLRAVRMVAAQGLGYLGQALSSAEQVAAAFAFARPGLDRLVCSPGHYVIGPFAAAAELGLLDEDLVMGYGRDGPAVEAIGTERSPFPDRFIHGGMAEANMMGMAGALARCGYMPFVHTFGVFATRRPFDQIANAIAYPGLPVRIIGFMPGVSTPGGPSHQATDDVALMRALPNMTVVDVADAVQTRQVVEAARTCPGRFTFGSSAARSL